MENRWLFKARKESDNNWTQGFLSWIGRTNSYLIDGILVKKNTICQCSGLKNRDDNLIFEDDVYLKPEFGEYLVVKYNKGHWEMSSENYYEGSLDVIDYDCLKLVGNIHDKQNDD